MKLTSNAPADGVKRGAPQTGGSRAPPLLRVRTFGRDRAKESSPKIKLNRRTLYQKLDEIPMSSRRLASPMSWHWPYDEYRLIGTIFGELDWANANLSRENGPDNSKRMVRRYIICVLDLSGSDSFDLFEIFSQNIYFRKYILSIFRSQSLGSLSVCHRLLRRCLAGVPAHRRRHRAALSEADLRDEAAGGAAKPRWFCSPWLRAGLEQRRL